MAVSGPLTDAQLRASPISVAGDGGVTAFQGTNPWVVNGSGYTQPISASALPLPTGAATSALQTTGNTSLGNIDTKTPALGQALMAASSPVVIASNQSNLPVGTGTAGSAASNVVTIQGIASMTAVKVDGSATTQPVSGTVTANQGTSPWVAAGNKTNNAAAPGATNVGTLPAVATAAAPSYTEGYQVGLSLDLSGSQRVKMARAGTAAVTQTAGSASSVTLLSSNTARLGCSVHNDSSAILYVKFGTTASTTSYTIRLTSQSYYECPFNYTGRIDGIWASAAGNAYVTELTQ
jgi:hypothetical protein